MRSVLVLLCLAAAAGAYEIDPTKPPTNVLQIVNPDEMHVQAKNHDYMLVFMEGATPPGADYTWLHELQYRLPGNLKMAILKTHKAILFSKNHQYPVPYHMEMDITKITRWFNSNTIDNNYIRATNSTNLSYTKKKATIN
jgi:hypothetical protein